MSALRQPRALLTAEEYLQLERDAEFKSEYVNGHINAMAGAKVNHNRIAGNILRLLGNQLRSRPGEAFGSDMKVRIDKANVFRYPDVSGTADRFFSTTRCRTLTAIPRLLSRCFHPPPSCSIVVKSSPSIVCLIRWLNMVLVQQDRVEVEVFTRDTEGRWSSIIYNEPADSFPLPSIGCTLTLAEIYEKVTFA